MGKPARLKNISVVPEPAPISQQVLPPSAKVAQTLYHAFEGLGLTPYQARVMVALLQSGPANCLELARTAGIPRTSIYQILDELDSKGVASRLPGSGPAVWTSMPHEEVRARLVALEEERLSAIKARSDRVGQMLDQLLPKERSLALPYVHVLHDASRVKPLYDRLLAQTGKELLVFNRPPYLWPVGIPQPAVIDAVRRVHARVLYQRAQVEDADYDAWRHEMEEYHSAGAQGRVVDELPIKLAVFDRKNTLLSLDNPTLSQVGFPTTILVEHPGYAAVQAAAFDQMWALATPYEQLATTKRPEASRSTA